MLLEAEDRPHQGRAKHKDWFAAALGTSSIQLILRGGPMAGKIDQAKGRVKKAVGELTDNEELKREGDIDKVSGKVKAATEKVADKAREANRKK
jgi:uncharacterized protein YjbJ (UPF0337 family)